MVLLQTLVMSVILSMIAVMVMKWVLARYMLAARNYRASEASAHSKIFTGDEMSRWSSTSVPSGGTLSVDGYSVKYKTTRTSAQGAHVFDVEVQEDK